MTSPLFKFTQHLIKNTNLFWQYPVITEKTVFLQQKNNPKYFGIPWATIIDKKFNLATLIPQFRTILRGKKNCSTTCQHIHFRKIIPLCKMLGIGTIYSPHKVKGEEFINGIRIKPCPLYAVNYEDLSKNKEFREINNTVGKEKDRPKDFYILDRKYHYSFMGGYQPKHYMSNIRANIFKHGQKNKSNNVIFIKNTGEWHFNPIVYRKQVTGVDLTNKEKKMQNIKTSIYNNILLNSRFSLCPSGSGPNSIRFWESLACGSIPILLSDRLELPYHPLWKDAIVRCHERDLDNLDIILGEITAEQEDEMRQNCLTIYNDFRNDFLRDFS